MQATLKGKATDDSIISNLIFCGGMMTLLFISFVLMRRYFKDLYESAISGKTRRIARVSKGKTKEWFSLVINMTDKELLPWVGLDAFLFLQTIKLIIKLLILTTVPGVLILSPLYFFGNGANKTVSGQLFDRLSLLNVQSTTIFWVVLVFNYYMTLVVFYGIYIFFRDYVYYRQVFISAPSTCISQISIRKRAMSRNGFERAKEIIDLSTRTVIICSVSSKYTKSMFIEYLRSCRLADIESVTIVQSRHKINKLIDRRNRQVCKLESELKVFFGNLLNWASERDGIEALELERILELQPRIDEEERIQLMKEIVFDTSKHSSCRPLKSMAGAAISGANDSSDEGEDATIRFPQKPGDDPKNGGGGGDADRDGDDKKSQVDAISVRFEKLKYLDSILEEATKIFCLENESFELVDQDTMDAPLNLQSMHRQDDLEAEEIGEECDRLIAGSTMMSWSEVLKIKKNIKDYGLTLWGSSMSIVVTFASKQSASIAEQTLLSARPFAMKVRSSGSSDDVIWKNVYTPVAQLFTQELFVFIVYLLINLLLGIVQSFVQFLLVLENFERWLPFLSNVLRLHDDLRGILKGILAPLFYNLFLVIAPYILYALAYYQGNYLKTDVQYSLLQMLTWLLFTQSFILTVVNSSLIAVLESVVVGNYRDVIGQIKDNMPTYTAFFVNVIIQRACISLMIALIRPGLFISLIISNIKKRMHIRYALEQGETDRVFLGALYPEYVIFVFMVTLAFLPLVPVIGLAGLLFYGIAMWVFRYHFIHTFEIPHESGGKYWSFVPVPILLGCVMAQFFTAIVMGFMSATKQLLTLIPLVGLTIGGIIFVKRVFERQAYHLPLGDEGIVRAKQMSADMKRIQKSLVRKTASKAHEPISVELDDVEDAATSNVAGAGHSKRSEDIMTGTITDTSLSVQSWGSDKKFKNRSKSTSSSASTSGSLQVVDCANAYYFTSVPVNFDQHTTISTPTSPLNPATPPNTAATTTTSTRDYDEDEVDRILSNPYANPTFDAVYPQIMMEPTLFVLYKLANQNNLHELKKNLECEEE